MTTITPDAVVLSVSKQGMDAQAALLPYALLAFGLTLPFFVWAASHAANAAWMSPSFAVFAIGWAAFYAVVGWLKTPQAKDLKRRARVHILGGLIWAAAIAQLAAFADAAGPARETLLLLSLGAGMICVVFTTPWMPSLLLVAPAAMVGPLAALFSRSGGDGWLAELALVAAALALALALLVNGILRAQFALAAEREALITQRADQAEAARRLARSKSDLMATLSDEIRNGLTGVAQVLCAAAGRDSRIAPSRQQLGGALDAVNDLLSVLNTTVDAETAEAGNLTIDLRPVDLTALIQGLMDQSQPSAAAKGLELSLHVDPELATARGATIADPRRTRQALAALIGNAVKFTVRGRVEARLSLVDDQQIAVEVADTGPGLSEEELSLALQPFRRVTRTSAGSPGAGLGLSLASQLAQLMGGNLSARSALGVGSCFTVLLPYDPGATADAATARVEGDGQRLRILALDEEPLSAAMLRACLEQLGHQVAHAADGERAVQLTRLCDFDLTVIDQPEAITTLRALDGAAGRTPVLALIGGDPEEAQACLAAGANALLRRPVTAPAAARAIADVLSDRSPAGNVGVAA